MSLSAMAVRRPVTTAMFFLGVGLLGVISLGRLRVELLPEVVFPEIYVAAQLRGASPDQVERDIVMPVEGEVARLDGVVEIESTSTSGRGTVRISYAPGSDMKFALLQVQGRMARLQPLLPEQTTVAVQRFDTSALGNAVMEIQVLGEGDVDWLRQFAEENVRPELESVDGVVTADILGGRRQAVEVIVDPERLLARRLPLNRVTTALNNANRPRQYLGRVIDGNREYPVSLRGQFTSLEQVRATSLDVATNLRIGDVADVHRGVQERTDLSRIDGRPAVGVRVQKEDEANLIAVAAELEETVERLNLELAPEGVELIVTNSQAELMQEALTALERAAVAGLLLGLAVLFLFLRDVRFVAVLGLAIPASLLLTFNLMYAWDLSLNVLSLCGLALAVGMLTDNGIVVMESIFKQFERGKTAVEAARDGTADVGRAVIASTATTVTVFVPVIFLTSDFQDLLTELALAVTFPLAASLLVALTLVPMLGARALARSRPRPRTTGKLAERYLVLLKACLRHRIRMTAVVMGTLLVTVVAAFFLLLRQDVVQAESRFSVSVQMPEGTTLEATDDVVRQVEEAVATLDGVHQYTSSIREGQASITVTLVELADDPERPSVEDLQERLAEMTEDLGGGGTISTTGAGAGGGGGGAAPGGGGPRIGASRRSSGLSLLEGPPPETAVIRGHDFATLQMIADDLAFRLAELEELDPDSVDTDVQRSTPEAQVVPDALPMFDRGMEVGTVLAAIEDATPQGRQTTVGFLDPDGTETPIEVRTTEDPDARGPGLAELRRLPVVAGSGDATPLEEVARVRVDEGQRSIVRTDQSRRAVVTYRFTDEVLDSQPLLDAARLLVRDVTRGLALPEGYTLEIIEGETDAIYYWMMGVAALLVYMILASLFESFGAPITIFGTLPPAVVGSCAALMLAGMGLSSQAGPMAILGFVVLIGIAVNNGIILVDAIGRLRLRHGYRRERAVLEGARSRLRPILMTSATTLLGVLPLALQQGGDFEIWPPFAVTVLGGLSLSMVSTLFFIPSAYMGIDQVWRWLRRIGPVGVVLATAAAAGTVWLIYDRFDSLFWTSLSAVPIWLAFLLVAWTVVRVHRSRVARRRTAGPVRAIRLKTLTKVYGAPGRLRRDWGRFARRQARLRAEGQPTFDRRALREGLGWKVPLLGLLVYLDIYFTDPLWIWVAGLATTLLVGHLASDVGLLVGLGRESRRSRRLRKAGRWLLGVGFLTYGQWRLGATSITVATALFALAGVAVRRLARRVEEGVVDLESMTGFIGRTRRLLYLAASKVPLLGARQPTFTALAGVDLEIGRGMFGLLGPNGAGKTTLMRIVCQVLRPTYGSVQVDGIDIRERRDVQGLVGYLPQHFGLYDHMTALEYLEYRALLEGFRDRTERRERVLACLEQVNLDDRKDDPIGSFSGGMRQRVGIAQTLLHAPRVIVVDEPTAGLDPVERIRFRNLLARLSRERIVIFSTHIVEDIAGSCNRLAVLAGGKVLYTGTPTEMRDAASGRVWEVVLSEDDFAAVEDRLDVVTHLRTPAGIRVRFLAGTPPEGLGAEAVEPTLEDAYLELLGTARGRAA